ncbi:MFS transporter [Streptomyces pacificus]|nr:MFS transporter [Streptomyces pacificus]
MWKLLRSNALFRRLFLGEAFSSFGDSAMFLSLAIWAKDLTGSDAAAGIVFLIITAPGLTAPLLGHLVDRVQRRPLLLRMYFGMAVLVPSLLLVRGAGQLWIIYLVTLAYGLVFATPARQALLKDLLPSDDAVAARSLLITTREGVRIVSPVAGAGVYAAFGGGALAYLGSATFLVAGFVLLSVRVVESEPEPAGEPLRRALPAGFRFVLGVPLLRRLTLAMVGFLGVVGLLETAAFAAVDQGLGRQPEFIGVMASVQGGGSVVGGVLAGLLVKRVGEARSSGAGYALVSAGLVLCVSQHTALFLVGAALIGTGLPFVAVAIGTASHLYAPARMQGRVNSAVSTLTDTAQTMSIAAGAALIVLVDYRVMYGAMALSAVACALAVALRPAAVPPVAPSVADEGPPPADAPGGRGSP